MRIDCHAHNWLCHADIPDPAAYVAECTRAGIDRIVLIEAPKHRGRWDECFDVVRRFGEFVIPVLQADMANDDPDQVHRMFDRGARGVKFISPEHAYSHERYLPLYEAVKARDGVAVFHTGYLMHTPDYDPIYAGSMENMRPAHIDAILRQVPHLKVLMAHFGSPYWDECATVISRHPTVYTDFSGGLAIRRSMFLWQETLAPNGDLWEEALSKVCFGTDAGYFREGGEMDDRVPQYIDFYERLFDRVGAPLPLRERVNSGNILQLFG
jgi:predicted TIM-barrel fold metal-dependent hydrolase